ncbi:hypothetical protein EOM39_02075 [Candidatus Gracilibacteria bacterium]|nr:hypothetical protein [Candidatus Gracilibacteria bacterium]
MVTRILTALLVFSCFGSLFLKVSADEMKTFIVTAYYSPLPDQQYYLKGNYEDEIKLNGRGIRGASGLEVFNGMLAGPAKYPFGTKIYLEGIGTGIIADRGGAIVEAGERGYDVDRIDVWMGTGDEGLKKALSWGKRRVKGKVVEMGQQTITSTSNVGVNYTATNYGSVDNIYKTNIGPDSSSDKVKKLQTKLSEIGLYKGKIDGTYNSEVKKVLIDFQIENGIIKSRNEYGAGYWGAKTRSKISNKESEIVSKNKKIVKTDTKNVLKNETVSISKDIFTTYVSPESTKDDVKLLQKKLKELALYNGEINGNYGDIQKVVLNYQLDKKIIGSKNETGAGYFGPKTRESLKKDYSNLLAKKEQDERNRKKIEEIKVVALKEAKTHTDKIGSPKVGETSQNVRELQKVLSTLGYFEGKDTAIYGDKTKESIVKFQIDKKLVTKASDPGAGKIGDKTKEALKNELAKLLTEKRTKELKTVVMNYKK